MYIHTYTEKFQKYQIVHSKNQVFPPALTFKAFYLEAVGDPGSSMYIQKYSVHIKTCM